MILNPLIGEEESRKSINLNISQRGFNMPYQSLYKQSNIFRF